MTPSGIAAALTREPTMDNHIGGVRQLPSPDEVARLAYHVYEMNGRRDGHDVEDWLWAERELTRLHSIFET